MLRDIPVGNGSLVINFGVWVDGGFRWVHDEEWERELRYESEILNTQVRMVPDQRQACRRRSRGRLYVRSLARWTSQLSDNGDSASVPL
ncbi:MAG: hypothetical protein MAG451_01289 [Anaerolineales bacterium]|nr:hypothetical protein [Anaerolineales bacterium]